MRAMKMSAVLAAGAVAAGAWTSVFGSSLSSVGVLDPTQPYSEIRAVSQDGTYAVGSSKSVSGTNVPIVWSSSDGLVALPNPSGNHTIAHGVSVGISANFGNIVVSGLHEGNLTHRYYKAPLGDLAGGLWGDSATAAGFSTSDLRGGTAEVLRSQTDGDGRWYTAARKASDSRAARLRGDPFIGWDTDNMTAESVSGWGVIVGRNSSQFSPSKASWRSPQGDDGEVPGGDGVRADGYGISAGFGKSTSTDFDVQWISGQIQNYNGDGTTMQAFRWNRADAAMTFLGSLAPAGGGDTGNNSSCAYTVADNGVTAGHSYFGALGGSPSYYEATVWDTSGAWDTTGTAKSVQALLAADGVDTSAWTHLQRVYAASDGGRVLAGYGIWAADGSTRGFVAKITPAAPMVQITNITVAGGTVTVGFTSSSTSDTTASFAVQHCDAVNGTYADVSPAATFSGSAASFEARLSTSGSVQFYRIRRL